MERENHKKIVGFVAEVFPAISASDFVVSGHALRKGALTIVLHPKEIINEEENERIRAKLGRQIKSTREIEDYTHKNEYTQAFSLQYQVDYAPTKTGLFYDENTGRLELRVPHRTHFDAIKKIIPYLHEISIRRKEYVTS